MADVDFTNAIIEPYVGSNNKSMEHAWLDMKGFWGSPTIRNSNNNSIVSNLQQYDLASEVTTTHFAIRETGQFTASGTEFYFGWEDGDSHLYWKIYNINFASGDSFDFKIEVDLSVV